MSRLISFRRGAEYAALAACLTLSPAALGQRGTGGNFAFEVAAIHTSVPGAAGEQVFARPGGKFRAINATVRTLVAQAFGVRSYQVYGGPSWIGSAGFDIDASGNPSATSAQMKIMLQQLLIDRFQLRFHRETKSVRAYALAIDKGGLKLRPVAGAGRGIAPSRGMLIAYGATTDLLARSLSDQLGTPVVNETEQTGFYDFKLTWEPDETMPLNDLGDFRTEAPAAGASIFSALPEQLGLRLQSTRSSVSVVIVDNVQKPTEN